MIFKHKKGLFTDELSKCNFIFLVVLAQKSEKNIYFIQWWEDVFKDQMQWQLFLLLKQRLEIRKIKNEDNMKSGDFCGDEEWKSGKFSRLNFNTN